MAGRMCNAQKGGKEGWQLPAGRVGGSNASKVIRGRLGRWEGWRERRGNDGARKEGNKG